MTSQSDSKITLDDLDYGILNILIKDAKRSYVDIGKELDVSSGTVFVRVKKMTEYNVIQGSHTDINYSSLGFKTIVFLNIKVNSKHSTIDICDTLIHKKNIVEVTPISGHYDIICKLIIPTTEMAGLYIENEIKAIEGIEAIETNIAMAQSKKSPLEIGKVG